MPPRTLKETSSRKKSSEFVEAAIDIQGAEIGTSLAEKLSTGLEEGEDMPDIPMLLTLMRRRLGSFRAAMIDAARAHADELANDDAFRKQREEAMKALSRDYVDLRDAVTLAQGPELATAIGFEINVAREPAALELQVDRLIGNFLNPELTLPAPRIPGMAFSPLELAEVLQPNLDRLKAVRAALDREHHEADETLLAKNKAVEEYDREFSLLSRCFEASFALAGRPDLAQRVRPSIRRLGRRQEVEEDPEPGEIDPTSDELSEPEGETPSSDAKGVSNAD